MGRLLSVINRYVPLLFLMVLVLAIAKAFHHYWPFIQSRLVAFVAHLNLLVRYGVWVVVLLLFMGLGVLAVLSLMSHAGRLPQSISRRRWIMDILDRLTNRVALEGRLSTNADATFIDADALSRALKSKLIGQDAICDDLAAQIRRRLALQQRGKPVGIFLFAGNPGTGKTYMGKRLATELERKLLHIDMTQFSRGMAGTALFGSPRGYVGSDNYGKLTSGLRDSPDAVVLLDEIEKADPEIHKKFLTAWNDGFITEASDGKQISTTRAIFVLTTNAAIDVLEDIRQQYSQTPDEMRRASTNALKESGFAPEVLSRIDRIFVFSRLTGLDVARVTALEIERMIEGYGLRVADQGIDPEILYRLMERQEKLADTASSRDLMRAIEESIADSLIAAKQQGARCVALVEGQGIVFARPVACPE
ncbi:MAG: AAA family ATPase [Acidithiobacillus sp.]